MMILEACNIEQIDIGLNNGIDISMNIGGSRMSLYEYSRSSYKNIDAMNIVRNEY